MLFSTKTLNAAFLCGLFVLSAGAQDKVTNAFDDLNREGAVMEKVTPMREAATPAQLKALRHTIPQQG